MIEIRFHKHLVVVVVTPIKATRVGTIKAISSFMAPPRKPSDIFKLFHFANVKLLEERFLQFRRLAFRQMAVPVSVFVGWILGKDFL